MKTKARWILFSLLALIVISAVAIYVWFNQLSYSSIDPTGEVTLKISPGTGAGEVAALLSEKGVTEYPDLFRLFLKLEGLDSELKAGTYRLNTPACFADIAAVLTTGEVLTTRFTIPEGLQAAEIATRLEQQGLCDAGEFLNLAEQLVAERYGVDSVEGYLYPETYEIAVDVDTAGLVRLLLDQGDRVWEELTADFSKIPDRHRTLTLAAVVQAEGAGFAEFSRIAGVFANRLERGMALESCATVLFALGEHKQVLEYRDLKVENPYNTYQNAGLPPGPICNPGRAALAAALNPDQHDYLFFVSNGDGTHTFSQTLAQHNAARVTTREDRAAAVDPEAP
ncbi:endolytic transglycosylase MltG [bacterium]|nr:endolytic transglycosylase MltG [bacterium]